MKINSDRGLDYVDNFVFFAVHIFKIREYQEIKISDIKKDFEEEYGLLLPYHAVFAILNKCKKRGYIYKENKNFFLNKEKIIKDDFSIESSSQQRKINEIIKSFKEYILSLKMDSFTPTEEECEAALLSFIRDHNSDILSSSEGSVLPSAPADKKTLYFLGKFIDKVSKDDAKTFDYLIDLSFGQALADTIVCDDFKNYLYDLSGLHCYLDANIIFGLLGIDGLMYQTANEEFLNVLVKSGAKLFIFSHTHEEIIGILNSCLKWLEHPRFEIEKAHRAMIYFVSNNKTKSDVELLIIQLESVLQKFKITIQQKPIHDKKPNSFEIDEASLEQKIKKAYGYDPIYPAVGEETINRDIDSISAIYRLRRGMISRSLKSSGYIFITTNNALAYATHLLDREHFGSSGVSPCLTDNFVGRLLWIYNPQKYREVNKKKFLADASSIAQPSKILIKRYLAEIIKLKNNKNITEEQYFLLKGETKAINMLGEKTFNNLESFNSKTAQEILSDLQEERAKEEKKYHEKTKTALAGKIEENTVLKRSHESLLDKIKLIISTTAKIFSYLLIVPIIPVIIVGSFYLYFPVEYQHIFWVNFSLFCLISFSAISLISGFSLRGARHNIEDFIYKKLYNFLFKEK
jgi:hypothetical protein